MKSEFNPNTVLFFHIALKKKKLKFVMEALCSIYYFAFHKHFPLDKNLSQSENTILVGVWGSNEIYSLPLCMVEITRIYVALWGDIK